MVLFEDLNELLGWTTGIFFSVAILNFFVKFIHKKVINKLGKDKRPFVDLYRKMMKVVVRSHRLTGIVAALSVLAHFLLTVLSNQFSWTGVVGGLLMGALLLLGLYGAYIYKKNKGLWLQAHRIISFILLAAIVFHLLD
jgi:hypothetical protein